MSEKTIYDALRAAGMSAAGACAMMGNMYAESSMKSNIAQRGMTKLTDEEYTAAADNGTLNFVTDAVGYGLCQWTYKSRKAALLAFAADWRVSVGDELMQVAFCLHELKTEYKTLYTKLCSSEDLYALSDEICRDFERPAVNNYSVRREHANRFYERYGGASATKLNREEKVPDGVFDPSVLALQTILIINSYQTPLDGVKNSEFIALMRQFINDMEKC